MGADLNNIIKTQKLSDDHVQFLIYQIIRGMKYYSLLFISELYILKINAAGTSILRGSFTGT